METDDDCGTTTKAEALATSSEAASVKHVENFIVFVYSIGDDGVCKWVLQVLMITQQLTVMMADGWMVG